MQEDQNGENIHHHHHHHHRLCNFAGVWTCELESGEERATDEVELSVAKEPEVFVHFFIFFLIKKNS